jgi:hypothetical protein
MVNKLLSIFFLFIFFLFQYGKIIDYMECRVSAAIESKTDCGCDTKLAASSTDNTNDPPFHQHHLKNYTEEFFHHITFTATTVETTVAKQFAAVNEGSVSNRSFSVFQPPRI